jgi:putative transposase
VELLLRWLMRFRWLVAVSTISLKEGSRGRRLSTHSGLQGGLQLTNEQVIEWIKALLDHPFVCYGYDKVTDWLRQNKALIINKKKVYRLMKQARLLLLAKKSQQAARCFVEMRVMAASQPGEAFQFDIKMYWVSGLGWVPCLSVIDIFTRQIKAYLLQASIRQADVKALWQDLLGQHRVSPQVQIRQGRLCGSQRQRLSVCRRRGSFFFRGSRHPPRVLSCGHAPGRRLY